MLTYLFQLFLSCLMLGLLTACADAGETSPTGIPVSTRTNAPNPTKTAGTTPTTAEVKSQNSRNEETFLIGEVRFASQEIQVASRAVAATDFNQDGWLDLVTAGDQEVSVLLGDGAGNFTPAGPFPGGEEPNDFAFADLDEDGYIDIAIANHDTDYLTILHGDGLGRFQPAVNSPLRVDVSPHPHVVRAADLDGDGHVDLLVDHRDGEGLLVLRGFGEGIFGSPGNLVQVGGDPYLGMALGDLDGNGRPDIVTPNPAEVGVLLNTSAESITFERSSPVPAEAPFAVGLVDFDADGRLDLVAASDEGSSRVEVFLGDGQGGFGEAAGSPIQFSPGGKSIAVGDFNGDGFGDAAVASYLFQEVLVLLGGDPSLSTLYLPGGENPWGLAAGDINADGIDDLVIADDKAQRLTIYLSLGP